MPYSPPLNELPPPPPRRAKDPIVEANRELLLQRSDVGVAKYGVMLDRDDLSELEWLMHHLEELLDAANYTQRRITDLKARIEKEKQDELACQKHQRWFNWIILAVTVICVIVLGYMCLVDKWQFLPLW